MVKEATTPSWFDRAIRDKPEECWVTVNNSRIHYLSWRREHLPGMILVHGGGAHAHWWDHIAPILAQKASVVAIDLSGMGDSDCRDEYSFEQYGQEIMAIVEAENFDERVILVAHSFGANGMLLAALSFGTRLSGIIVVDSPIMSPQAEKKFREFREKQGPFRPKRYYPDKTAIIARFRLIPPQPCENDYILAHIAQHSVREELGGWTWKFDDRMYHKLKPTDVRPLLKGLQCRSGVIYGEHSALFGNSIIDYMRDLYPDGIPFVGIPAAHHHIMLDQPLALISAIKTMSACW